MGSLQNRNSILQKSERGYRQAKDLKTGCRSNQTFCHAKNQCRQPGLCRWNNTFRVVSNIPKRVTQHWVRMKLLCLWAINFHLLMRKYQFLQSLNKRRDRTLTRTSHIQTLLTVALGGINRKVSTIQRKITSVMRQYCRSMRKDRLKILQLKRPSWKQNGSNSYVNMTGLASAYLNRFRWTFQHENQEK